MDQRWVAPIGPFHIADGTAYANSVALTDVSPAPQVQLPRDYLDLGRRFEFYCVGQYSNTGTPTLTLGLYSGTIGQAIGSAAAVCVSSAITTVSAVTARTFRLEGHAHITAVGASGTVRGMAEVSNVSTGATDMAPATSPFANVTIDTTVARYFAIGATWGTASASNTLTIKYFGFRLVN